MYRLLSHFFVFFVFIAFAFTHNASAQDNANVLSIRELYAKILTHHPIVKQANLMNEMARREVQMAWGGFDPKLKAGYDQKQFNGTEYYSLWSSKFVLPTWIGDVQLGYDRAVGTYLNPQARILPGDAVGQTLLGLSVPIAKGFWIDERRSTLLQARIYRDIADAEKIKMVNKVLLSAAKDYWEWYFAYRELQYVEYGVRLAQDRFEAVQIRVRNGELAGIDSVQARITLQERQVQLQQARIDLQNTRLAVSNYLWAENESPLEMRPDLAPETFDPALRFVDEADLRDLRDFAQNNHPDIRKIVGKREQLGVEERLQMNNLLPNINLEYNLLRNVQGISENTTRFNMGQNYKWGLQFELPLLLRKERGKLGQVRVKQSQANFELTQTRREILNQVQAAYNLLKNLEEQIRIQQAMVRNYEILLEGERRRFAVGESSLFQLNAQEAKLIESQIKLEAQRSKYEKARAELTWAAGGKLWE